MATHHVVEQGECMTSIAHRYGFGDPKMIYNRPENDALRRKRPDPNLLAPGDVVYIPDKVRKSVDIAVGKEHNFVLRRAKRLLRLQLQDHDGKPLDGMKYTLEIAGATYQGTTGSDGMVRQEVPADAREGRLVLDEKHLRLKLLVGDLDPVSHADDDRPVITGVQARLNNLGFDCPVDGDLSDRTTTAVRRFQEKRMHQPKPDGNLDQRTLEAIRSEHGC